MPQIWIVRSPLTDYLRSVTTVTNYLTTREQKVLLVVLALLVLGLAVKVLRTKLSPPPAKELAQP